MFHIHDKVKVKLKYRPARYYGSFEGKIDKITPNAKYPNLVKFNGFYGLFADYELEKA